MNTTAFLILSFSSLFAVIDPLGVIPFFSGLTAGRDLRQKRKILIKALVTAFLVLMMFTVVGHQLLRLFGITVDAFRIAGGVIFFGIGLDMLQSKPRRWHTGIGKAYAKDIELSQDEDEDDDPSITPLAIPMIAGPGSITTGRHPDGRGRSAGPTRPYRHEGHRKTDGVVGNGDRRTTHDRRNLSDHHPDDSVIRQWPCAL
jgi:multiple antibiotic resistance protein